MRSGFSAGGRSHDIRVALDIASSRCALAPRLMTPPRPIDPHDHDRMKLLRRRRSIALLIVLLALAALFFAMTLVKIAGQAHLRRLRSGVAP